MKKILIGIFVFFVGFFIYAYFSNSSPLSACLFGKHTVDIENIHEDILGQGMLHMNDYMYSENGDTVGYIVPVYSKGSKFFYVKENKVFGPFEPKPENTERGTLDSKISRKQPFGTYLTPEGWPDNLFYRRTWGGIQEPHTVAGHTISVQGVGGTFALAEGVHKQVEVLYDGRVVGKETADCEFNEPVENASLVLSQDGLHFAYIVKFRTMSSYESSLSPSYVVVDGKKTKVFDNKIENLHFENSDLVFNTLNKGGEFVRVTIPAVSK
jgi:hypothetical protein